MAPLPSNSSAVPPQGAITTILDGAYVLGISPLSLFLAQSFVVIVLVRLLSTPLVHIHQPRVIAEIIAGICLGPSALGKIPGFTNALFPAPSLGFVSLLANFGLLLFIFTIGLELDIRLLCTNATKSVVISLSGILLPFICGVGVSKLLYDADQSAGLDVPFASFMAFLGVAMSITAFPVLARIITDRKLISTSVAQMTLSAAAIDDLVAWSMLILVVSLINNSGSSLTGLYTFLLVCGYAVILVIVLRPFLEWYVTRCYTQEKAEEGEPVPNHLVTIAFLLIIVSAWFTEILGIHGLFGAFLVGLVMPHANGFSYRLVEKIEDVVTIIFLPLYFANSGLNTRLDLLNDGTSWGFVVLVTVVACFGKIVGCGGSAWLLGRPWRESLTIGILMNTKGLVELIVLNLGLEANIISPKTFTIMVVMAVLTTMLSSPLVSLVYPHKYHMGEMKPGSSHLSLPSPYKKIQFQDQQNQISQTDIQPRIVSSPQLQKQFWQRDPSMGSRVDFDALGPAQRRFSVSTAMFSQNERTFLFCLPSLQAIPTVLSLVHIFKTGKADVHVLRLRALSDRYSSLMMLASEPTEFLAAKDLVMNMLLRLLAITSGHSIESRLAVVPRASEYADPILECAFEVGCRLIVVPYIPPNSPLNDGPSPSPTGSITSYNSNHDEAPWIRAVFEGAPCTSVLFVDRGFRTLVPRKDPVFHGTATASDMHRIVLYFLGGDDDREALIYATHIIHATPSQFVLCLRCGMAETLPQGVPVQMLSENSLSTIEMDFSQLNLAQECIDLSAEDQAFICDILKCIANRTVVRIGKKIDDIIDHATFLGLAGSDLIVFGRDCYHTEPELSGWVEGNRCPTSVSIVKRHISH
ncbi:Sodium/hydrogen exchanger family-domain-containing protein [Polychytrium aggregatum]|uniref:Sodium/hydrogen exchanger family-domain-containing protein n=1 Tax=Polychytrium aggregatum TaxID=110093 RepID=UPI0022FE954B|nr:Sodium/hydrogen exchanger family-domain-containing protein [Polychytrium aggregatum]KAI9209583.1 Sodium/hydrogen exchanger family-domain-containing protein [Polychytrium aggregatum]